VVNCGRRWGKTVLGVDLAVDVALGDEETDGLPVGWFAPTYKLLAEPWAEAKTILADVIESKNESLRQLRLVTGGTLDFWSLDDGDAGRGRKYARVVIDEAAMSRNLEAAWNNAIRPTLADYRGDAWMFSTPKGHNFFWKAYTFGQDDAQPEWRSWSMPTSTNPYIDKEEIEAARSELPELVFAQEFLAEFLADGGSIFRGVGAAIDKGRKANEPPKEGASYALGVDVARVEDFTVICVLDASGRQVYFERFNQISWERAVSAIARVAKLYNCPAYLDSTGVGDPIHEQCRKAGVSVRPYAFTNASKESLIDNLAIAIERGEVRLMDVAVQTSELLAYQYEVTPSRNVRMNAPPGMHDDTCIALALAAWGIRRPRSTKILG
jgi:phage FluMu gp28-like protein